MGKKPEIDDKNDESDLLKILKSLKSDLVKLQNEDSGPAMLSINNVEVELAMTVEKKAGGGFKIGVVHLGGDYKKENINRIKIDLTPFKKGGGNPQRLKDFDKDRKELGLEKLFEKYPEIDTIIDRTPWVFDQQQIVRG